MIRKYNWLVRDHIPGAIQISRDENMEKAEEMPTFARSQ